MSNVTKAAELRDKIKANRYDTFTLPTLDITVEYRKPDLLKLAFNNTLPAAMADAVINSYREALKGTDLEAYQKRVSDKKPEVDDEMLVDVSTKGYTLLDELVTSHAIKNVPTSDFDSQPVPLIAWNDIPEEDAIAFLFNLLSKAQAKTVTEGGHEVTAEDLQTFPDEKRGAKRNSAGKS